MKLEFNSAEPKVVHIDINSCFATIEQQANPLLRGKPVAVAAYTTKSGCILAASIEAKVCGIRTGTLVKEGKSLCPGLIVRETDPEKYRFIHKKLKALLSEYSPEVIPKSIDEFVLMIEEVPESFKSLEDLMLNLKQRINQEIGDWIKVSIGIGPNRFLAKTAAGLKKPDGLERIDQNNFLKVYEKIRLIELNGIGFKNELRLRMAGINSVLDFYRANRQSLRTVFGGANGEHWYLKLRGFDVEEGETKRRSFGHSYSIPRPYIESKDLWPILTKLLFRAAARMRQQGYQARGIHLLVRYKEGGYWQKRILFGEPMIDSLRIMGIVKPFFEERDRKIVRLLSVSFFDLSKFSRGQLFLFEKEERKNRLIRIIDRINQKWDEFAIVPATMAHTEKEARDQIGFGRVNEAMMDLTKAA